MTAAVGVPVSGLLGMRCVRWYLSVSGPSMTVVRGDLQMPTPPGDDLSKGDLEPVFSTKGDLGPTFSTKGDLGPALSTKGDFGPVFSTKGDLGPVFSTKGDLGEEAVAPWRSSRGAGRGLTSV